MTDLMVGALELTGVGMGFVFTFLIILVFATALMSRVTLRYAPAEPAAPARRPQKGPGQETVDADTAKAIEIAVGKYRSRHKK